MSKEKLFCPPLYLSIFFFVLSLGGYIVLVNHFPQLWDKLDLQAYYNAGLDLLQNKNIYTTGTEYFDFLYPPYAALIFSLFTLAPLAFFKWAMTSVSILCLLTSCWLSLKMLGYRQPRVTLATTLLLSAFLLWLEPVQQTLEYGQINIILMTLVLLGFSFKHRPYLSGLLFGLAVSFKLTPIIFIVFLFVLKRFRIAAYAISTIAVTIIIGFLTSPISSQMYWHGLFLDTTRIGDIRLIGNQSISAMIARIVGTTTSAQVTSYILSAIVGIGGLLLAKKASGRKQELLSVLLIAITGLLVSPFSWSHHWVWIVPFFIFLFHQTYSKQYYYGWLGLLLLYVLFGWLTPLIPNLSSMHHILNFAIPKLGFAPFLQENAYVLFGLLFLTASVFSLYKHFSSS